MVCTRRPRRMVVSALFATYVVLLLLGGSAANMQLLSPARGVGGLQDLFAPQVILGEPVLLPAKIAAKLAKRPIPGAAGGTNDADGIAVADNAVTPAAMDTRYSYILEQHNVYRADHGVVPLAWDDALAVDAEVYAAKCVWGHNSTELIAKNEGENLALVTGTTEDYALSLAINSWYAEVSNYDFANPGTGKPGTSGKIGHFTQVVWKASSSVGCAVHFCAVVQGSYPNALITVCRYSPPGNWMSGGSDPGFYYRGNVFPAGSTAVPEPSPSPEPPSGPPSTGNNPPGTGNSTTPPDSSTPPNTSGAVSADSLPGGNFFQSPGCLVSKNMRYSLCLAEQPGELQLLDFERVAWKKVLPVASAAPYLLALYPEGPLVVIDSNGRKVWTVVKKGLPGSGPYKLMVTDRGRAALYGGTGKILWTKKA